MVDEALKDRRADIEDNHTVTELKRLLEEALGDEYTRPINSQRNDLIEAFFRRVGVNPREVELEIGDRSFDDLVNNHGDRHALATALNPYLANEGIRARTPTKGLTKGVLAGMITAIEDAR